MKKFLAFLAAVAMIGSTQAASINWTVGGVATRVLTDYVGEVAGGKTFYLTLGDSASIASITDKDSKEEFYSALSAITVASATTQDNGRKPSMTAVPQDSDLLEAGKQYTFAILFASEDVSGNGFFKYEIATATAYTTGDTQNAKAVTTSFANLTSNNDWKVAYSVPEPGTAVLALLGVGMLIKRRRS